MEEETTIQWKTRTIDSEQRILWESEVLEVVFYSVHLIRHQTECSFPNNFSTFLDYNQMFK